MANGRLALGKQKNPVRSRIGKSFFRGFNLVTYNLDLRGSGPLLG